MATSSLQWVSRSSPLQHRSTTPPGYPTSRSSPAADISSPIYSDRPIRPLPKRRIRDRLSTQQTEDIVFPSIPSKEAPLFSFPYPETNRQGLDTTNNEREVDESRNHDSRSVRRDTGSGSGPDGNSSIKQSSRGGPRSMRMQGRNVASKPSPLPMHGIPIDSANSSVDGDEGFENTNNKKKRKIPQPQHGLSSASGLSVSNVSSDMANLGISSKESDTVGGAEASDNSSHSVSGTLPMNTTNSTTKGRLNRSGRGSLDRRPLVTSTNALNLSGSARSRLSPSGKATIQNLPVDTGPGIISSAIANAQHSKVPLPPQRGNENVSLLEQANKTPQTGNFTFTCDPPTDNLVWPGESNMGPSSNSQAYPTPPSQYPNPPTRAGASNTNSASQTPQLPQDQHGQQPPQAQPKKPRRRPGRIYEMAARERRSRQELANHHHPPRREDIWICEFCEYEAIYGQPPRALIHLYEVKDRKEQQRQAERRRLLEKAKIKGRKGKKAAASAAKQASKSLAHQAAEFQKNEMLRATAKLETHKQQLQQAHRELQAHNAAAEAAAANQHQQQYLHQQQMLPGGHHQLSHDQLYDDDLDDDDLEYDDDGIYDDENDGGDTEELDESYYPEDIQEPPPPPPPPDASRVKKR